MRRKHRDKYGKRFKAVVELKYKTDKTKAIVKQRFWQRIRWLEQQGEPLLCHYCTTQLIGHEATVDHAKPLARGGADEEHNWRVCCNWCNRRKGQLNEDQYFALLDQIKKGNVPPEFTRVPPRNRKVNHP